MSMEVNYRFDGVETVRIAPNRNEDGGFYVCFLVDGKTTVSAWFHDLELELYDGTRVPISRDALEQITAVAAAFA